MAKCTKCGNQRLLKGAIINSEFGEYCMDCIRLDNRQMSVNAVQYGRDRDREDHARDLIQPRDRNGYPSAEFIKEYPEEAKKLFSEEELEKFQ